MILFDWVLLLRSKFLFSKMSAVEISALRRVYLAVRNSVCGM